MSKNKYLAREWAKDIESPVIIIHGDRDEIIPIKFSLEQAKNFKGPPQGGPKGLKRRGRGPKGTKRGAVKGPKGWVRALKGLKGRP